MRHLPLAVLLAVSGCLDSSPPSCEDLAEWRVELSRVGGSPHEGAEAVATRMADGSIVIAILDSSNDVQFGSQRLRGANLARVSEDGTVLDVVLSAAETGHVGHVFGSDDGEQIIVSSSTGPDTLIAAYDKSLGMRWTQTLSGVSYEPVIDVGPRGEVFTATNLSTPFTLIYLSPDGTTRWQRQLAPGDQVAAARFADNGDVFVFINEARERLAAADGSTLSDVPAERSGFSSGDVSNGGLLARRDGSYVTAGYASGGRPQAIVTSYDTSAQQQWSTAVDVISFNEPSLAANGDLTAMARRPGEDGFELLSFDVATGIMHGGVAMCGYVNVFSVEGDHYYGLGLPGSPSVGLARFANSSMR